MLKKDGLEKMMRHQKEIMKSWTMRTFILVLFFAMSGSVSFPVKAAGGADNSTRYYLGTGKLVNAGNNDGF